MRNGARHRQDSGTDASLQEVGERLAIATENICIISIFTIHFNKKTLIGKKTKIKEKWKNWKNGGKWKIREKIGGKSEKHKWKIGKIEKLRGKRKGKLRKIVEK